MTNVPDDKVDFAAEFPPPPEHVVGKMRRKPNGWLIDFVQATSLFVIATIGGDGSINTSIRGGKPGFLAVNGSALEFDEIAGNMLFETARAAQANANVGLLLIVPGINEVVRVRGRAVVSLGLDPLGHKRLDWRIEIIEWYYHCARALKRSGIFDPAVVTANEKVKANLTRHVRQSDGYGDP